jgi:hypothetical protein
MGVFWIRPCDGIFRWHAGDDSWLRKNLSQKINATTRRKGLKVVTEGNVIAFPGFQKLALAA